MMTQNWEDLKLTYLDFIDKQSWTTHVEKKSFSNTVVVNFEVLKDPNAQNAYV